MEFVEETLLCPITLERMKDPVIAQDGWTYERKAIMDHFKKNRRDIRSPMTNLEMDTYLIENRIMASMLKELKDRPITVAVKEPEKDALWTEQVAMETKAPSKVTVRPSVLTPGAKMMMIVKPPRAVKDRLENLQIKYGDLLRTHREVLSENKRLLDRNYDLRCALDDQPNQIQLNQTIRQLHSQVELLTIERDNLRAVVYPSNSSRLGRRTAARH
jgi:hypothetical protein